MLIRFTWIQIDTERNAKFTKTGELPVHLTERLKRFQQEEQEKQQMKNYKDSLVNVLPYVIFSMYLEKDVYDFLSV